MPAPNSQDTDWMRQRDDGPVRVTPYRAICFKVDTPFSRKIPSMSVAAKKSTPVRIVVRDGEDPDNIIHDRTGDHNDRFFREWITSTTWWALRNNKTVSMYPAD